MRIEAYLFFDRNAEETMKFYQSIFGGELTITRRGEVDPDAPEDMKPLVINAQLDGDGFVLRGSDNTDVTNTPQHRVAVTLNGSDEERMTKIFDGLSDGGTVFTPLEKMFWGDLFGVVIDKYGITWQMNIEAAKNAA